MRPFPSTLSTAYPALPGALPERPWWRRQINKNGVLCLERTLDLATFVDHSSTSDPSWSLRRATTEDESSPLPHPGVRVGQVWAMRASSRTADDPVITVLAADRGRWLVSDMWVHDVVLRGVLQDAFLLMDMTCPWLAPWGPASNSGPVLSDSDKVTDKAADKAADKAVDKTVDKAGHP